MSAESHSTFDQLSDPSVPRIPLVVHVPHCATVVPLRYRDELVISDDELARELLLMTDHYTDELAMSAVALGGVVFRNRVSRLVMDPERFEDDAKEEMAKRGMGAVYVRRHGGRLRRGCVAPRSDLPTDDDRAHGETAQGSDREPRGMALRGRPRRDGALGRDAGDPAYR